MENFINDLNEIINRRKEEVVKYSMDMIGKEARKLAKELRQTAPSDTGEYKSGFTSTKVGDTYYIYTNKKRTLGHLLEYGHLTRDGTTRTRAFPHIYNNKEKIHKTVTENINNFIERGGYIK